MVLTYLGYYNEVSPFVPYLIAKAGDNGKYLLRFHFALHGSLAFEDLLKNQEKVLIGKMNSTKEALPGRG